MDDSTETVETPSYTLSLKGEGITLEQKVTKDVALAVINVALGGAAPSGPRPGGGGAGQAPPTRRQGATNGHETPGEFVERVKAQTNPDKIVAFGAYLQDDRGQADFTREDIKAMFRAAHESPPANFPRDFRTALSSNRIAQGDTPDRYFVTRTGRTALENEFSVRPARRTRRRGRAPGTDGDEG